MIEAKGIRKSFASLEVLKGIDFSCAKGEIVAIMGASGAGKSTLLQILGTLSTPDSGSLSIDGTDVLSLRGGELSAFRGRKIGFVFQFHHLLPEFTALENVMMPALIAGQAEKTARKRAGELLDELGLAERAEHKYSNLRRLLKALSAQQFYICVRNREQQRVAIARALINDPAVIFADEPTGNLDSVTKKEIQQLFLDLRASHGQSIVIVTHDPELASACDRCLNMKDGLFV